MSRQLWTEELAWATANGTAVGNSTTEGLVFPNLTIPANYMQDGRSLRMRAFGSISNVVTAQPTVTFRVRWSGIAGTVLASTGAITASTSAFTAAIWDLEVLLTARINGAAGTIMAIGSANVGNDAAPQARGMGVAGALAPAAATALDLTVDTALSITAQWSAASASNTVLGMNYYLSSLN